MPAAPVIIVKHCDQRSSLLVPVYDGKFIFYFSKPNYVAACLVILLPLDLVLGGCHYQSFNFESEETEAEIGSYDQIKSEFIKYVVNGLENSNVYILDLAHNLLFSPLKVPVP